MINVRNYTKGTVSLIFLMILSSCQPVSTFFVGKSLKGEPLNEIILNDGSREVWSTAHLVIDYNYKFNPDALTLSGSVALNRVFSASYDVMTNLDVFLFLLDNDENIIHTELLVKEISQVLGLSNMSFARKIKLPASAKAIAFGYRGELKEAKGDDDEAGANVYFTKLPK